MEHMPRPDKYPAMSRSARRRASPLTIHQRPQSVQSVMTHDMGNMSGMNHDMGSMNHNMSPSSQPTR